MNFSVTLEVLHSRVATVIIVCRKRCLDLNTSLKLNCLKSEFLFIILGTPVATLPTAGWLNRKYWKTICAIHEIPMNS